MVHTLNKQNVNFNTDPIDTKPQKFIVWLCVISSTIMFGGWTSYYIVFSASKGKGHGLVLPEVFIYSTIVLLASSVCLFLSLKAFKQHMVSLLRILLWLL